MTIEVVADAGVRSVVGMLRCASVVEWFLFGQMACSAPHGAVQAVCVACAGTSRAWLSRIVLFRTLLTRSPE